MRKIYLASSWRNAEQPQILRGLRDAGHEVYDFRNPAPGEKGFAWSEIDPAWEAWSASTYRNCLSHSIAIHGYERDWQAMLWADTGVLLLPAGRSAHIEAGYFVGAGKPLFVLLSGQNEPELMYRMAFETGGALCLSAAELLEQLGALAPEAPHE